MSNPNKTLPKAFILGTILVTSLYIYLNAGFLNALGIAEMQGENFIDLKKGESAYMKDNYLLNNHND